MANYFGNIKKTTKFSIKKLTKGTKLTNETKLLTNAKENTLY